RTGRPAVAHEPADPASPPARGRLQLPGTQGPPAPRPGHLPPGARRAVDPGHRRTARLLRALRLPPRVQEVDRAHPRRLSGPGELTPRPVPELVGRIPPNTPIGRCLGRSLVP